jgi:hypothetical protein
MNLIPYSITLVFEGIDFDADDTMQAISEHAGIGWRGSDGLAYATITRKGTSAIVVALEAVKEIRSAFPSSKFQSADRNLVSAADIAERSGVHMNSVLLWAKGERGPGSFPKPAGIVNGNVRIWSLGDVNVWLTDNLGLGEDVIYPTFQEFTQIDAMAGRF